MIAINCENVNFLSTQRIRLKDITSLIPVRIHREIQYLGPITFFISTTYKRLCIYKTKPATNNNNIEALVRAIKSGKVRGACLDVLEYEKASFENLFSSELPPAFQYLVNPDKVVLSPHIVGWTHESNRKMAEVLVKKISEL